MGTVVLLPAQPPLLWRKAPPLLAAHEFSKVTTLDHYFSNSHYNPHWNAWQPSEGPVA